MKGGTEEAMSNQPWCCFLDCDHEAEFDIYGDSAHHEDNTQACEAHVGALLGTPDWLLEKRGRPTRAWTVVPIARDHYRIQDVLNIQPTGWHLEQGAMPAIACYTKDCEDLHHVADELGSQLGE